MDQQALQELIDSLPDGVVVTAADTVEKYRFDRSQDSGAGTPAAVVRAEDAGQVQTAVRWAARHRVPVVPRGAGSGLSGGSSAVDGGLVLSLERMRAVQIDTATPAMPGIRSPTRWVSRMYAAQHTAAPSANATPTRSVPACHGSVSSTTPTAASPAYSRPWPRPRHTATPSGPRNSSALAVPIGRRAIAAMNRIVSPAVTTPSSTQARNDDLVNWDGRGRPIASISNPAQASRIHAAPSAPMSSNSPTETAMPSCTQSIEPTAMEAPARAAVGAPGAAGRVVTAVLMRSSTPRRHRSRPRVFAGRTVRDQ